MNDIIAIAKKELLRFFTDRRMIFTVILFPGLMIYIMYTFMGFAFSNMFNHDEENYQLLLVNPPASVSAMVTAESGFESSQAPSLEEGKQAVKDKEAQLLAVFPSDFDSAVAGYSADSGGPAPDMALYFDSSDENSSMAYSAFLELMDVYESQLANKFDINRETADFDLSEGGSIAANMMSSMLPMLLLVFLFAACLGIVPESIAGEKERGTIATLLVTPLKRSHLAIGKVVALGVIALCSGISSFIGTFLSLPKLMNFSGEEGIGLDNYNPLDYVILIFVIFSTLLLMVAVICIVSAFSKSVKEASSATTPFMIIIVIVGLSGMFGSGSTDLYMYLIPIYNSAQTMAAIFAAELSLAAALICALSNLAYASICVWILTKMFHSETLLFSK